MMKIWKLYILFIYIYIYTITQIFVKRFFEFPYRLSRLTVHRAYIYMKNPIPSIKSFIYLYRDYSKISNDNISKFLSKSTSPPPQHRCHRLSEIRTADRIRWTADRCAFDSSRIHVYHVRRTNGLVFRELVAR